MIRIFILGLLLLALFLLPFTEGETSRWMLALFSTTVSGLLCALFLIRTLDPAARPLPWRHLIWPLIGFLIVLLWLCMQGLSQPLGAHPIWRVHDDVLGTTSLHRITIDRDGTAVSLLNWMALGSVFAISYILARRRDMALMALWGIVWIGVVYAFLAVASYVTEGALFGWGLDRGIIAGPFASKNSFATFLGISLLAALGLSAATLSDAASAPAWKRMGLRQTLAQLDQKFWISVATAFILLVVLMLAQSRGATLSLLVAIISIFALMYWSRMINARAVGLSALALGIPLTIGAFLAAAGIAGRFDRLALFDFGRGDVYIATANAISDAWPMGTGAGAFEQTFPMYRFSTWGLINTWEYAHNGYLETFLALGVPIGLLLFALIGWAVWQLLRSVWFRKARLFSIVGLGVTVLLALHAVTDFSLQIPSVSMFYTCLLGVCVAQVGVGRKNKD